jgi:hypothetical protein
VGGIIFSSPVRGPVAQLGARLTGSQKVRGSNPLGSTRLTLLCDLGGIVSVCRHTLTHRKRRGRSVRCPGDFEEQPPFDDIEQYVNELLEGGAKEIRFAEPDTSSDDYGLVISDRRLSESQLADGWEQYEDSFEPPP